MNVMNMIIFRQFFNKNSTLHIYALNFHFSVSIIALFLCFGFFFYRQFFWFPPWISQVFGYSMCVIFQFQITKIDHHRGPVSGLQVSHVSGVLVSASHDATVCLWSLDNFTLLNTFQLNSPILNIQISSDSVSNFCFSFFISFRVFFFSFHSFFISKCLRT